MKQEATILSRGDLPLVISSSSACVSVQASELQSLDYLSMYGILAVLGRQAEPSAEDMYSFLLRRSICIKI